VPKQEIKEFAMQTLFFVIVFAIAAAVLGIAEGGGTRAAPDTLVATSPDGTRIALASAGMRNVRVLRVSGGSVVRLREVFVPEGEAVSGIAWSADGQDVIVTTHGPKLAVDTRTWRVEGTTARAGIDTPQRTRG
jgi:WD40 repeat protein